METPSNQTARKRPKNTHKTRLQMHTHSHAESNTKSRRDVLRMAPWIGVYANSPCHHFAHSTLVSAECLFIQPYITYTSMYKYNRTVGHPCLTASDTEQIASEIVGIRGDTFCHIIAYTRNNLDYITAGLSLKQMHKRFRLLFGARHSNVLTNGHFR